MSASLFANSWSPPLRYRLAYSRPADASIRTLQPYTNTRLLPYCSTPDLSPFRSQHTRRAWLASSKRGTRVNTMKTLIVERYQELARIFTNISLGTKFVNSGWVTKQRSNEVGLETSTSFRKPSSRNPETGVHRFHVLILIHIGRWESPDFEMKFLLIPLAQLKKNP